MWQIVKAEIAYNKSLLLLLLLLTIIFTVCAVINLKIFNDSYFLGKYFWSIVIGLGSYLLIYIIWALRVKEKRERLQILLPVGIKRLAAGRWLFGILPFLFVFIYLEFNRTFIPPEWFVFIDRIYSQLSLLLIFLVTLGIARELWYANKSKYDLKKLLLSASICIIIIFISFLIVNYSAKFDPVLSGRRIDEVIFIFWGIFLSIFFLIIYIKRKSFLS